MHVSVKYCNNICDIDHRLVVVDSSTLGGYSGTFEEL